MLKFSIRRIPFPIPFSFRLPIFIIRAFFNRHIWDKTFILLYIFITQYVVSLRESARKAVDIEQLLKKLSVFKKVISYHFLIFSF
jgi:hypothetical protein